MVSDSKQLLKRIIYPGQLLMGLLQAVVGPTVSAVAVANLCFAFHPEDRPLLFWIVIAPVLYLAWLTILLLFYTLETSLLGYVYEKPGRIHEKEDGLLNLPFLVSVYLYGRAHFLFTLPFVLHLVHVPLYRWLIYRSYAIRTMLGKNCWITFGVSDPDLTIVGPEVIVGDFCRIIAHNVTRSPDGYVIFQTAPIELGARCVIGGGAQVEMGAVIGADSIVEPLSRVPPFARIPPGEIWGGNPAVFRATRETSHNGSAQYIPVAQLTSHDHGSEVQKLVAEALSLPEESVTSETSASNCLAWDSIGKMSIAAALHDRFKLRLSPEEIFTLDSVADVERFASRAAGDKPAAGDDFILPANPELFPLFDPAQITAALARQAHNRGSEPVPPKDDTRIVIAATFVAQPVASSLQLWSRAFGIRSNLDFFDFNEVQQALLSPDSAVHQNRTGLNVVIVRPEDLPGAATGKARIGAEQLLAAIESFQQNSGSSLLVGDLPPVLSSGFAGSPSEIESLRTWWRQRLDKISGVEILCFAEIIEDLGKIASRDPSMELAASVPYSAAVYQRLGISIARAVRRMRVPAKKVLALDCDGTLWGGVLAEDGVQLGDDSAGRSFRALQSQILSLKKQGVLLVLVSKNDAEDVWKVFDDHPDMVLRRKDIAAARINWQRKSQNLREIAAELNLGLDSFVLLDDDPVERMEVEANCPQVTVIPLNPNVERSSILPRLWLFDGIGATREDSRRDDYVQDETQRNSLKESAGDLQSYLRSLDLKVSMRKAREDDLPRVAQLIQKTNQFNLSLKRRSLPEIRALPPEFDTWVVSVRDRFGDYGLVGACISRPTNSTLDLDSLVVSCRALGRGVEEAFLQGLAQMARAQGIGGLVAHYVEGLRNQPIKIFLTKSGFSPGANGDFRIELSQVPSAPSHLQLEIE